jgi:SNF2 family DNA or RNA helicase
VIEMLEDPDRDPLGKTIIWAHFQEDIKSISEALSARGIKNEKYYGAVDQDKRDRIVTMFNSDDTLRVMICNPQTGGVGLNLLGYSPAHPEDSDMYTNHNIFFSQGWSAILRRQAEDRAHRRGTRCQVRNTDLMVPGTIDEEIRKRVHMKREVADSVTDLAEALKEILK